MQIQVNHDNRVRLAEDTADRLSRTVEDYLSKFADRITRVEMHLSDLNGGKGGSDKRCMLEARMSNLQPIAVHSSCRDRSARHRSARCRSSITRSDMLSASVKRTKKIARASVAARLIVPVSTSQGSVVGARRSGRSSLGHHTQVDPSSRRKLPPVRRLRSVPNSRGETGLPSNRRPFFG